MNYFKRLSLFSLLLVFAATLLISGVYADIIYVPDSNSFFLSNISECPYHGRSYTAADPSGMVKSFNAPDGKSEKATYPNGTQLYITHTYTDSEGVVWGISARGHLDDSGWMKINSLSLIYDYISFAEEHGSEFTAFDAAKYQLPTSGEIKLWKYPGSGIVAGKLDAANLCESQQAASQYISQVYTSPDGRVWGFIKYIFSIKNVWVCLDDKGSEPETTETAGQFIDGFETALPEDDNQPLELKSDNSWIIPIIAAAVLAVAAGIMISIYYERKKK